MTRPNALAPAPSASGHTHGQQTGSNPCRLVCLPGPSGACQSRKEAHLAAANSSRRRARRGVSPGPNAERPAALPLDLVNPAPRTLATRLHRQLLGVPRQPRMASRSPPVIDAACAAVSEAASGDDRIAGTIVAAGSLAWSGATQRGHQGRLRMPPKPAGSGLDYPSEVLRGLHSLHMPRCAGAAGLAGELLGVELVDHLDNVDVLVLQLLEVDGHGGRPESQALGADFVALGVDGAERAVLTVGHPYLVGAERDPAGAVAHRDRLPFGGGRVDPQHRVAPAAGHPDGAVAERRLVGGERELDP